MSKHCKDSRPTKAGSVRCPWPGNDPLYIRYHDREWGVPLHDDRKLFEFMVLETFQAGLSWLTVLRKRDAFRAAMDAFDPEKIARYDESKIRGLMRNAHLIRNRRKLEAAVKNARTFLALRARFGTFDAYIWRFVDGRPVVNHWRRPEQVPSQTAASRNMSRDLKLHGFTFVGPTICYAYMQAVGMVNDHIVDCFRHREIAS